MPAANTVSLVNNSNIDFHTFPGTCEALSSAVKNNSQLPETLAGRFTLKVVIRPSGSKYEVINNA